jgi:hypothetical protein
MARSLAATEESGWRAERRAAASPPIPDSTHLLGVIATLQ